MISLEKRAYRYLRKQLLHGRITAGTRLSDLALSREIGMSRTPVRHAIRMLESDGLVAPLPGGGSVVRKPTRKAMAVLFDLRIMAEGYAAARAARSLTERELAELRETLAGQRAIAESLRGRRSDQVSDETRNRIIKLELTFHQAILRATGVRAMGKLVSDLGIMARLYYGKRSPTSSPFREVCSAYLSHTRVLRALERRDPKAARDAMRRHIRGAKAGFVRKGIGNLSASTKSPQSSGHSS
jgi:DNA-binding GntR family transcriptional regulator